MKSMSLEEFLKMLKEDNSSSIEEFMQKLSDKAETKEKAAKAKKEAELKKLKQNLHETIDAIETEKELQYFCWQMGTVVFAYFKEKVLGDDE